MSHKLKNEIKAIAAAAAVWNSLWQWITESNSGNYAPEKR